jgi:hypothetical protein
MKDKYYCDGWDGFDVACNAQAAKAGGKPRIRLQADPGMFRVVGVDTFEGPTAEYMIGDFDDPNDACQTAREHGRENTAAK